MNNHQIIIETLSPLHIGKGDSLTSVGEYVATSNRIRIIDQVHLRGLLEKKNLQKEYLAYILNYAKNTHVWDFFTDQQIEQEIQYTREFLLNANVFNPESNNILELATETCAQKYIPGSSLKGAIRTLVFAWCIGADNELKSKIERCIASHDDLYTIRKQILNEEEAILNKDFNLFRIEDSALVDDQHIVAEISKRQHLFGVKTEGLDNLRECIASGTKIRTAISLNPKAADSNLQWMNRDDLTGLFQVINTVMNQYIDHEIKLLGRSTHAIAKEVCNNLRELKKQQNQFGNDAALLRIGKGKAFIFQVILPMLSEKAQDRIMQLLVRDPEVRANYPKTRVLTESNQMFGWVKISMPEFSTDEITYFNNVVDNPVKGETKLKAYFLELKKVCLLYNGTFYPSLQLVNQLKETFKKGQEIEVTLQQLSNEGKIIQVKLG